MRTERGIHTFIIDRVFVTASGRGWIVDFKTSRHEGGGLEAFLDEHRNAMNTG
jgi:hypothetical protein